jgi:hypothetical protein
MRISQADVQDIVSAHFSRMGEADSIPDPVWRLWRGRMGLSKEQQIAELLNHGH